jgi:hypothetical protein
MNKGILKSKTFWVSLVVALAPLFPVVSEFISGQPEMFSMAIGGVFTFLRFITKDKVSIV